jgi:hypothetical protein
VVASGRSRLRSLLVPTYLFAAAIATTVLDDGGPGWLNVMAVTCVWNAMKFASLALTPIHLLRMARRQQIAKKP